MPIRRLAALALVLLSPVPAFAQSQPCGAELPRGSWIGGSEAASDLATAPAPTDRPASIPANGYDVTLFTLSAPADVRLEAAGRDGTDPLIELYDATGALVLFDDDSGGRFDARGEIALETGRYCLATRSYDDRAGQADLRIGLAAHPALTPGSGGSNILACTSETAATALGAVAIDQLPDGSAVAFHSVAQVPYYRFTLQSRTPLVIRATNPRADPYIYLYDAQGQLIDENDDHNSLNSRLDFPEGLPAGSYCIGMRALSDASQPVQVSVAAMSSQVAQQTLFSSAEASPPADGSAYPVTQLGPLETRLSRDASVAGDAIWHAFTIDAPGRVTIDATGFGSSDPIVYLFGGGTLIAQNDDANGTLDSQVSAWIGAGSYTVALMQYHGQPGTIRLEIRRER
ncbi:MAG: ABC transporter substrate-binding protein [Nioella sp.]|nr:ABC transporter substrate-binding protein [Nioella sp.]